MEELKSHLKDLGAYYVVTEEDLKSSEMKELMKVHLALHIATLKKKTYRMPLLSEVFDVFALFSFPFRILSLLSLLSIVLEGRVQWVFFATWGV